MLSLLGADQSPRLCVGTESGTSKERVSSLVVAQGARSLSARQVCLYAKKEVGVGLLLSRLTPKKR